MRTRSFANPSRSGAWASGLPALLLTLSASPALAQGDLPRSGNLGRVEIVYEDGLDAVYEIVDSLFKLDGVPIHPTLPKKAGEQVVIYTGVALPGAHELAVVLKLKGATSMIFTYLEGYSLALRQNVTFGAKRGETVRILVKTFDRGFTYDFTQRAGLQVERVVVGPGGSPPTAAR